jgi:hypothetical protein
MTKIFLLNDTIKSDNLGCQIVSHQLRKTFSRLYGPKNTINPHCAFTKKASSAQDTKTIQKIKDSDFVYVNGEGSMSHGGSSMIYAVVRESLNLGKDVYFCNFTFDPRPQFPSESYRISLSTDPVLKKWKNIFSQCKKTVVRDPVSYVLLKKMKIENVYLSPDIGVTIENEEQPATSDIRDEKSLMFGVGSISKSKIFRFKRPVPEEGFRKIINHFSSLGYSCHLMDWPSSPAPDLFFLENIKGKNIHHCKYGFQEYYNQCKRSILNITGRHHGIVMSYAARTPFITFASNMWKTEADEMLYEGSGFLDALPINPDQWIEKIEREITNIDSNLRAISKSNNIYEKYKENQVLCTLREIECMSEEESMLPVLNQAEDFINKNTID